MSIGKLGLIKCGSNIQQCPTLAELTADATATASQIAEGATAYVKGQKITGTYEPEPCPTLAEMTDDATATASDIVEGKTAYARGEKLTGTLVPVTKIDVAAAGIKFGYSIFEEVPEIYDFSNVRLANDMFYNCRSLTSISGFDFSSVMVASNMFYNCISLTSISGFDFSSLSTALSMFSNCRSLTSISGIDFSSVTAALNMFKGCTALAHIHNDSTISCDLSFADSPLLDPGDAESYILGRLADLAGKATQTLTFNTALQSSISESAIQAATDKNWVVNFADSM